MNIPNTHTLETITKLYAYVYDSMDSAKEVNVMLRRRAALSATLAELGMEGRPIKVLFTTAHQCAAIKASVDEEAKEEKSRAFLRRVETTWSRAMFIALVSILGTLDYLYVQDGGYHAHVFLYLLAGTGLYAVCCDLAKMVGLFIVKRRKTKDVEAPKT